MPKFTHPHLIEEFTHRGHVVQIAEMIEGAVCCDVEYPPRQRECDHCKNPLAHRTFYCCVIDDGEPRIDLRGDDETEAAELAKLAVDEMTDAKAAGIPLIDVAPTDSHPDAFVPPHNAAAQMEKLGWLHRAAGIIRAHPKNG